MRQMILFSAMGLATCGSMADDAPDRPASAVASPAVAAPPPTPVLVPEPAWSPRPPRPHPVAQPPAATTSSASAGDDQPVQFSSEGKWDLAGYNNNEVIYTIFITSHDPRIIRCTTELKGFYYEKGEKLSVADRQSITVFPDQRVQAGNWQGMDQKSGATYAVKCHPT